MVLESVPFEIFLCFSLKAAEFTFERVAHCVVFDHVVLQVSVIIALHVTYLAAVWFLTCVFPSDVHIQVVHNKEAFSTLVTLMNLSRVTIVLPLVPLELADVNKLSITERALVRLVPSVQRVVSTQ